MLTLLVVLLAIAGVIWRISREENSQNQTGTPSPDGGDAAGSFQVFDLLNSDSSGDSNHHDPGACDDSHHSGCDAGGYGGFDGGGHH